MAALRLISQAASHAVGTVATTHLSVTAPAQQALGDIDATCDFDGTSASPANGVKVLVELLMTPTLGAGSGSSSVTLKKSNPLDPETIQSSSKEGYTGEPSGTPVVVDSRIVHPQAGVSFSRVPRCPGGYSMSLRTTPVSGTGPNARCRMVFTE